MITNLKRIYMSEADASGGNGAAPAIAPTQAEPAAPTPAAPAQSVDADAIASRVRDSLFAELRKAGVFAKKQAPTIASNGSDTTHSAAPSTPQPTTDFRSLDRALNKKGWATRLNDGQYRRLEQAYAAEAPSDPEQWVSEYFDGWAVQQSTTPAATAVAPAPKPQPQNAQPVSDRGAPPPSQTPLEEADLATMTPSDREALIRAKGRAWYVSKLASQLRGRRVTVG